jgi:hypothetical protein
MKPVYLHVGMPKTGTTFLQARCFPHLKGIRYQHKELTALLDRVIYTNPIFLDLPRAGREAGVVLEKMNDAGLLISNERLFGNMLRNFHDNVHLTCCLKAMFPAAKVIVVVRRQDTLVESIYKQSLQSYYYQRLDSFLNYRRQTFADAGDWLGPPSLDLKLLDLHRYVRHYAEQFGRENVAVLPYELLGRDRRAFLAELATALNVEPFYPAHDYRENRSYSWLSCKVARVLNRFVRVEGDGARLLQFIPNKPFSSFLSRRSSGRRVYRTLRALNSRLTLRHVLQNGLDRIIYVERNLINKKKRRLIMALHRDSNARLDEEFNLNLKSFGYY